MKILAVDTATEACSAALFIDGEILDIYQLAPREHTKLILVMAQQLLDKAGLRVTDLDALAFGRGPGSFTGVRIATGVVQGMAFAADLPVVAVSTLASIAQLCHEEHAQSRVLATIDARMGGVYWGCYELTPDGLMQLVDREQVTAPEKLTLPTVEGWSIAGSGWKSYSEELQSVLGNQLTAHYGDYLPHSKTIVRLAADGFSRGEAVSAELALPVYLRDDVAKKAAAQ